MIRLLAIFTILGIVLLYGLVRVAWAMDIRATVDRDALEPDFV